MTTDGRQQTDDHRVFFAYAPLGLIPIVIGGIMLAYVYAFASMVDPELEGWSRASRILEKMLPGAFPAVAAVVGGLVFLVHSVLYAAAGSPRLRPSARMYAVLAVGVSIACVMVPYFLG